MVVVYLEGFDVILQEFLYQQEAFCRFCRLLETWNPYRIKVNIALFLFYNTLCTGF